MPKTNRKKLDYSGFTTMITTGGIGVRASAVNQTDKWTLLGIYTSKDPVNTRQRRIGVIELSTHEEFERKLDIDPNSSLIDTKRKIQPNETGTDLGVCCNQSVICPNTQMIPNWNGNALFYTSVKNTEEELFCFYSDVNSDNLRYYQAKFADPLSSREIEETKTWLKSKQFSFEVGGDLEVFKRKKNTSELKAIERELLLTIQKDEFRIQKNIKDYLEFSTKLQRIKALVQHTFLRLLIEDQFSKDKEILDRINQLDLNTPWASCKEYDREVIKKIISDPESKALIEREDLNGLFERNFVISIGRDSTSQRGPNEIVLPAKTGLIGAVLNLNSIISRMQLIHPDTEKLIVQCGNTSAVYRWIVNLNKDIQAAMEKRYDSEPYCKNLIETIYQCIQTQYRTTKCNLWRIRALLILKKTRGLFNLQRMKTRVNWRGSVKTNINKSIKEPESVLSRAFAEEIKKSMVRGQLYRLPSNEVKIELKASSATSKNSMI